MHNEKPKKETRGRKPILNDKEKKETFRVGLKKGTIEKWGGVCHLREIIKRQLENGKTNQNSIRTKSTKG